MRVGAMRRFLIRLLGGLPPPTTGRGDFYMDHTRDRVESERFYAPPDHDCDPICGGCYKLNYPRTFARDGLHRIVEVRPDALRVCWVCDKVSR